MDRSARWLISAALATLALSCGGGGGGCANACFTAQPQGTFTGTKLDSAASVRLTDGGFGFLNQNSGQILQLFAPGNVLTVPVSCSVQTVNILGFPAAQLTIADDGSFLCTAESCGQLDGKCDAKDLQHTITINITSLSFSPKAPDLLEASIHATVQTGRLMISTVSRNSALCLFSAPLKCSIDFDTARQPPADTVLGIDIQLAVDPRWDKLLSLKVASIAGSSACTGSATPPNCIDGNDIVIAPEATACASTCSLSNISVVKDLLLSQLASSLSAQVDKALAGANCAPCAAGGACPTSGPSTSTCKDSDGGVTDAGACYDDLTGLCVPALVGAEGQLEVGAALAPLGVPATSALQLSFGAGGGAKADSDGLTIGVRGGFKEVAVADCVKPVMSPMLPALPLPDLDPDAPGPYDLGLTLSQQALGEALLHAQQSGALCMELGQETVALLDTSLLGTLMPSLNLLEHGEPHPLRIALRPVNPPKASVGLGSLTPAGQILEPLVRLDWKGVELDVYAQLDDRFVRLFTLAADVTLPLGLRLDGCDGLTPVLGDLTGAIVATDAKNSEILAEDPAVLKQLVPLLIAQVEPALANGFQKFLLPQFNGFKLKLLAARGISQVTGTQDYQHLGIYAQIQQATDLCTPMGKRAGAGPQVAVGKRGKEGVELIAPAGTTLSWRLDRGFWSPWLKVDSSGKLLVKHPKLTIDAEYALDVVTPEGGEQHLSLAPQRRGEGRGEGPP